VSLETALIVDDDPDVRAYMSEALRIGGFAVLEAADGTDALRIVETTGQHIEILVTDVNMPGIDGLELAHRVRALRPMTGILYVSGAPPEVVTTWGLAAGGVFLRKPFGPDTLLERVCDAMGRPAFGRPGQSGDSGRDGRGA
jgi:DNA-binding response OmpR family regulator